jgi:small subunit ribosomal protein S8
MSLQSTDPIADLLTRIRNAIMVGKREVRVPTSKLKLVIAKQLVKNGYIDNVVEEKAIPRGELVITINDTGSNARINKITRISKPGRRVYVGCADIPRVKSGRGIVLVSTSKGVMNDSEARKARLGGEVLLTVY